MATEVPAAVLLMVFPALIRKTGRRRGCSHGAGEAQIRQSVVQGDLGYGNDIG